MICGWIFNPAAVIFSWAENQVAGVYLLCVNPVFQGSPCLSEPFFSRPKLAIVTIVPIVTPNITTTTLIPMLRILFLLFVIVPMLEIYLLLEIGGVIGALPTIGLVILTAVLGAILIRIQGMIVIWRLQEKIKAGEVPAQEILAGVALLVAGALLLTPGFFTDTFGFLLLLPPFRQALFKWLISHGVLLRFKQTQRRAPARGPVTLEGDFRSDDD